MSLAATVAAASAAPNARQDDDEFIAAQPRNVVGSGARQRVRRGSLVRPQGLAHPRRDQAQELIADRVAERIVDSLEVVEIEIQHREHALMALRGRERARQSIARLLAIRQSRERIEIRELHDAMFGAPFARQRDGHLANFVRMKRLLQVRELLLGRHDGAHVARIDVGIRGAQDDFNGGIHFANARGSPHAIGSRRHAHVEERHRKRIVRRNRLAHGGDRRFRSVAKEGREHGIARREFSHRLFRGGFDEEPVAQTAQHGGFAVHVGFDQDLPVRIAHLRLIIDDEYANYHSFAVRHGCTSAVFMAIGVS